MSLQKVVEFVKKHNNFLVTSHTNSEGDALGSELAFYRLLKALKKNAFVVNDDALPYGYEFLPDVGLIKRFDKHVKHERFDVFATLDCSDLKRTGEVCTLNTGRKPVLNIDHHISNVRFGDVNWVDPAAASCTQMVYELYRKLKVPLDRESALLLYVGIVTDTGSFRYSNTTSRTHQVVADLLRFDFNIPSIYKSIYENVPFKDMRLLAKILPLINRQMNGKLIWYQIPQELLKKQGKMSFDLTEHVLSFARAIRDVEVVALFKENLQVKDEIRVNFRSQGNVDVNVIAKQFGGGGHRTASGATVHGTLDQVRGKVLRSIRAALRKI